jgi:hypothetical protein
MKTPRHQNESGIALILTLTILAVVMILLMSFIVSMRTERMAAAASSDLSRAKSLAEGAVDEAVGLLQSSTTNITPASSYVTSPGAVYTWNGTAWTQIPLFTGNGTANLNSNNVITGTGGTALQVGWQNIMSQGGTPRLVGRFAYWVDDEATKVDINTAQSRTVDPVGNTPAAIDLSQAFPANPSDAANILSYLSSHPPLDTIESVKLASPVPSGGPGVGSNSFYNSQYSITAKATSPDLTPWGTKRINLTNLMPANPSVTQKQQAFATIMGALTNNAIGTWSGGATFLSKYNVQPTELQQIAANIVDYIGNDPYPLDSSAVGPTDLTPPQYLGLKQTPYLNELVISNVVQLSASATPPAGTLSITTYVTAELWYMYTNSVWNPILFGSPKVVVMNIPNINITYAGGNTGPATISPGGGSVTLNLTPSPIPASDGTVNNRYVLVTGIFPQAPITLTDASQLTQVGLGQGTVNAIFTSQKARMDYAQIKFALPNIKGSISSSGSTTLSLSWASQCNDPRVKPVSTSWSQNPSGNTLGIVNSGMDLTGGSGTIPGDGDISCHIISGSNHRGTMYPSELAYIHTGIPWRTLFLEPQPTAEAGLLPDWLLVDMFSGTDSTNAPGRININLQEGNGTAPLRVQPLQALLSGNGSMSTVTNNILSYALDNNPALPSFVPAADKYFTTAGQICEVKGLADGGGIKAVREAPAQAVVNLVTPRSDQFTIWAIGQSIKKVAAGNVFNSNQGDFISGEVKIQAVVERYEDPSTTPATVRYRTLYYRYIYD